MTESLTTPPAADPPVIEGERGVSPIAGRIGPGGAGKLAAVVALAAGCGVFLLATGRHHTAHAAEPPAPARQVVPFEPLAATDPPTLAKPGPGAPSLGGVPTEGPPSAALGRLAAASGSAAPAQPDPPMLVFSRGGEATPPAAPVVPAIAVRPAAAEATELDQMRRGSTLGTERAIRLPDRDFLILAGTTIPCVLQTAMDTSTPGFVSCLVPRDVYSESGAVVLLEKGTKVLGEYRAGMKAGQGRLFVLWRRAVTPGGVAIALSSPASDALGRSGFDGDLDSHFWQRFGGALLLSVVDDGLAAAAPASGGLNVRLPSGAANTALQASISAPPTLRKAAGAEVAIFAAQDFDFSGVYGVRAR